MVAAGVTGLAAAGDAAKVNDPPLSVMLDASGMVLEFVTLDEITNSPPELTVTLSATALVAPFR